MCFLVVAVRLKGLTVSRKSERLVNLTIALLATKRYLTKSEIFSTVAGYSGDPEAKDRMFERDKDDLRSLGITIELGTFDPLFEDEAGYRISPDTYALQLDQITPTQLALLSAAAQSWREAALSSPAQSGLRKLKSLGIESDLESITNLAVTPPHTPEQLPEIIEAISERKRIRFEYLNEELSPTVRNIEPYRLSNSRGYWYLIGRDSDREEMRTFRLDRFASAVSITSSSQNFELIQDHQLHRSSSPTNIATVKVRKGRGVALRAAAELSDVDAEWDLLTISYHSDDYLIRQVLWLGTDAEIISPTSLRSEIISRLQKVVKLHG